VDGLVVLSEFSDGPAAINQSPCLDPDLILMNIGLPNFDGIQAIAALKASTSARVIVMTSHVSDEEVFAALQAGADGYCLTGLSPDHLIAVIHCVMGGGLWLDAPVVRVVVNSMRTITKRLSSPADRRLSERELQVLTLVVEGFTNQQIAQRLNVSSETIKTHMRRVMDKMSVSDRTQAAVKGLNHGLVGISMIPDSPTVTMHQTADKPKHFKDH